MNDSIKKIQDAIGPLRQAIINHKVYSVIKDVEDLKVFMQHHVYAVWDFMSLLKTLQNNLTCTTVPWFPKGDANTRFLINEIVAGEESDVDMNGVRKSHFELYLEAMEQCGADTTQIMRFISVLQQTGDLPVAYDQSKTAVSTQHFVDFTFEIINSNKAYLQSAVFTFGREDLIPGMFMAIVNDIQQHFPDDIAVFKYYLERHIEVDGGHHSQLALEMTAHLCGDDEDCWKEAEAVTIQALQKRIDLWDGVYNALKDKKAIAAAQ
jgi:pyrroloquinoline quinone (PQQ) biosynthesis protein C